MSSSWMPAPYHGRASVPLGWANPQGITMVEKKEGNAVLGRLGIRRRNVGPTAIYYTETGPPPERVLDFNIQSAIGNHRKQVHTGGLYNTGADPVPMPSGRYCLISY